MPRHRDNLAIEELLSDLGDDELPALLLAVAARLMRNGHAQEGREHATNGDGRLLTPQEAAARLAVCVDWVYRETGQKGKLWSCVVRLGRSVRLSEVALNRYLRSRSER